MIAVTCPFCGDMFETIKSDYVECPCCCQEFSWPEDGPDDELDDEEDEMNG
jgi:hypothetical protein